MIDADASFGDWLKQLRAARDLTQEGCAEQVGCAVETIGAFETGRRRPSRAMAERLADVLRVNEGKRTAFLRLARVPPQQPAPVEAPAPSALLRPRSAPAVGAPLIGRADELAEIRRRLQDPACRLLSLVGPGGIGKTRLALAAADSAGDLFADGTVVTLLAPVASAREVPLAIAEAAGYAPHGGRPLEDQLLDLLGDAALLLVLDNLEHLLVPGAGEEVTAFLRRLLDAAPGVRVLATSRERLRLRDERVLALHGLHVPHGEGRAVVDASAAVQLFVERAQRVEASFVLTAANRPAVSEVCRLLYGVPLAIELAASWVQALTPTEIAQEVRRGPDFLVGNERDGDARHGSMRVVFDQSWALLSQGERRALARLSVFVGGCEREAAAEVADAPLPLLSALLDKSLVRREQAGGATRYTLHELIRQYAAERLAADADDKHETERRHTAFYAALLERSLAARTGGSSPEAWAALLRDADNVRAAWGRATGGGDAATVRRMARSLWVLYDLLGLFADGAALFARAADALRPFAPAADVARGIVLGLSGYCQVLLRPSAAVPPLEEGIALLEAAGENGELALLLMHLGTANLARAHMAIAQQCYERALALAAADDHFIQLWSTLLLGSIASYVGDFDGSERNCRISAQIAREHRNSRGLSMALNGLSEGACLRGHFDEAEALGRESVQVSGAAHDGPGFGRALRELGTLALARGDLEEAHYLLTESCEVMRASGERWTYGRSRAPLVYTDVRRGDLASARQGCIELLDIVRDGTLILIPEATYAMALLLLAQGNEHEALALLSAVANTPGEYVTLQEAARTRAEIERRLAPAQRAEAARASQRPLLPWLEELCTRPIGAMLATSPAPPALRVEMPPIVAGGGLAVAATGEVLSAREVEVLRLIIGGASNQAIAEALVISPHTAKHHVASILAKLGAPTRTAAAVQGRALGLEAMTPL